MTDLTYLYDGSFEGFLCCVFESYQRREVLTAIIGDEDFAPVLFATHQVETDPARARRVYRGILLRSPYAAQLVRRGFLTCLPDREMVLYRLIVRLLREGPGFLGDLSDETLYPVLRAVRNLGAEAEKLRGFVRFSELSGVLGSEIEPKNRVLPILRGHFCTATGRTASSSTTAPTGKFCFTPTRRPPSSPWITLSWLRRTSGRRATACCGSAFTTPSPSGNGRIPAAGAPICPSVTGTP
jgi:hypothetical protein